MSKSMKDPIEHLNVVCMPVHCSPVPCVWADQTWCDVCGDQTWTNRKAN